MAITKKPVVQPPKTMTSSTRTYKTYKDVLNQQQARFWDQASQIVNLGGTLSKAQQKTYNAISNQLKKSGVNPTAGITVQVPKTTPLVPMNGLNPKEQRFWQQANQITQLGGQLNTAQQKTYSAIANKLRGNVNQSTLQDLSIRALNGDVQAQNTLKSLHLNPLTGQSLWKGYDPSKLQKGTKAWKQYMSDNPYSDLAKQYDLQNYQIYTERIKNNQPISPEQQKWYDYVTKKWGLPNYLDPNVQYQDELKSDEKAYLDQLTKDRQDYLNQLNQDRQDYLNQLNQDRQDIYNRLTSAQQSALDAQDVALNNALAQADQDNFQRFLDLQQQMTDRGMADSGIAADAYLRSQMAANQAYQNAYAQAAQTKANILSDFADKFNQWQSAYTDKIGQTKSDYTDKIGQTKSDYTDKLNRAKDYYTKAINAAKIASRDYIDKRNDALAKQALEVQKEQTERDKFLTQQTGYVYLNGKPLTDSKGKPIPTIEFQKLLETQRHNQATEKNQATQINYNYALGKERNAITAQGNQLNYNAKMAQIEVDKTRIATDAQIAAAKLKYAYAKLDLDKQKAQASINEAKAKLDIMAKNAQTSEVKTKISAIKTQLAAVQKQVDARLKAGKKPTKAQRKQLKALMDQLEVLVSGK